MFPLDLKITAAGNTIDLNGTVGSPRDVRGFSIGFEVSGSSLRNAVHRISALAAIANPPRLADRHFSVRGIVRDDPPRMTIDVLAATIGSSDAKGRLSISPASSRLDVSAIVGPGRLVLADFLPPDQESESAGAEPGDGRMFPNTRLPPGALRTIDATLRVDIGLAVAGNGTGAEHPFAPASGDEAVAGEFDVTADVSAHGASLREIMASMDGHLKITARDARIRGGLPDGVVGDPSGNDLLRAVDEDNINIECGIIDLVLESGIARPRMLAVETDGFLVTGAGEIDLRNEKLDLKLGLHSGKASPTQPGGAGFRVGGTFLHPVFNVGPAGDRAGQEHPSPACITAVRGKTSSFGTVDRLSDHW